MGAECRVTQTGDVVRAADAVVAALTPGIGEVVELVQTENGWDPVSPKRDKP